MEESASHWSSRKSDKEESPHSMVGGKLLDNLEAGKEEDRKTKCSLDGRNSDGRYSAELLVETQGGQTAKTTNKSS